MVRRCHELEVVRYCGAPIVERWRASNHVSSPFSKLTSISLIGKKTGQVFFAMSLQASILYLQAMPKRRGSGYWSPSEPVKPRHCKIYETHIYYQIIQTMTIPPNQQIPRTPPSHPFIPILLDRPTPFT